MTATVVDRYANDLLNVDKKAEAVNVAGNKNVTMIQTVDFSTDEAANSVIRLFKVSANLIPVSLKIVTQALGTNAAIKLGIFKEGGPAYDDDALGSAVSLASAAGIGSPVNGLNALTYATLGKKVYELAGHTVSDKDTGYDIAATISTAASSAGKAVFVAEFVQG